MKKSLLLVLAVTAACFSLTLYPKESNQATMGINELIALISPGLVYPQTSDKTFKEIESMLRASTLDTPVITKVLKTLKCADQYKVAHNNILTIIDYSLPSSEKRLWIFDLLNKKLLFNTYVSHGIKSGALLSTYFSNKFNSKSSSIGVYTTEKTYRGRHGLSLRLDGLDRGFNDNAAGRSVVMHGGWYVDESFIKKYGRAGRSWGCPALPSDLTTSIIDTIKEQSLFVMYYPSDNWFVSSRFLTCDNVSPIRAEKNAETKPEEEVREPVLFAHVKSAKGQETGPVLVIEADKYDAFFHNKPPLERMLRRQINNQEYIALSTAEFKTLANAPQKEPLQDIRFAVPVIKMDRGYYATEMLLVNLGHIKDIRLDNTSNTNYLVDFENRPSISLSATNQFIRWLGL
ncbi:MAG: murein L,D-transpeptidase catalytic domain family protein [Tatlockia sp.]|jgi:hypothetical protein